MAIPSGGDDPRPKNGDSAPSQAPPRIVWVASYPRSGNAFLRIVLDRPYGPRTSGVYDVTALEVLFWARPENAAAMELLAGLRIAGSHRASSGEAARSKAGEIHRKLA